MNEIGRQLHDRATRGETLTADEQAKLDAWYADQDREEFAQLKLGNTSVVSRVELQQQIEKTLVRLGMVTKEIQDLTAENENLRREIAALRRQVPQLV